MAVYTHLSLSACRDWFARAYALGEVVRLEGITQGVENSNYLLVATPPGAGGIPYILTLYERRVRAEDVPFYLGLMEHARAGGCAVPAPQRRADDALWGMLEGKPAAVVSFLTGANMAAPTPARLFALGQACAELHAALRDFRQERVNDLSPFALESVYAGCGAGLDRIEPGLQTAIGAELAWLAAHAPGALPRGAIHADLFPDNVFFEGERLSGLIDFYFACTDALVYELAVILVSWCMDEARGALNKPLAEALVAGYESRRPLEAAERAALPIYTRGAALRFLLTRAYDWIHPVPGAQVVVKDPREYLRKWRACQAQGEGR